MTTRHFQDLKLLGFQSHRYAEFQRVKIAYFNKKRKQKKDFLTSKFNERLTEFSSLQKEIAESDQNLVRLELQYQVDENAQLKERNTNFKIKLKTEKENQEQAKLSQKLDYYCKQFQKIYQVIDKKDITIEELRESYEINVDDIIEKYKELLFKVSSLENRYVDLTDQIVDNRRIVEQLQENMIHHKQKSQGYIFIQKRLNSANEGLKRNSIVQRRRLSNEQMFQNIQQISQFDQKVDKNQKYEQENLLSFNLIQKKQQNQLAPKLQQGIQAVESMKELNKRSSSQPDLTFNQVRQEIENLNQNYYFTELLKSYEHSISVIFWTSLTLCEKILSAIKILKNKKTQDNYIQKVYLKVLSYVKIINQNFSIVTIKPKSEQQVQCFYSKSTTDTNDGLTSENQLSSRREQLIDQDTLTLQKAYDILIQQFPKEQHKVKAFIEKIGKLNIVKINILTFAKKQKRINDLPLSLINYINDVETNEKIQIISAVECLNLLLISLFQYINKYNQKIEKQDLLVSLPINHTEQQKEAILKKLGFDKKENVNSNLKLQKMLFKSKTNLDQQIMKNSSKINLEDIFEYNQKKESQQNSSFYIEKKENQFMKNQKSHIKTISADLTKNSPQLGLKDENIQDKQKIPTHMIIKFSKAKQIKDDIFKLEKQYTDLRDKFHCSIKNRDKSKKSLKKQQEESTQQQQVQGNINQKQVQKQEANRKDKISYENKFKIKPKEVFKLTKVSAQKRTETDTLKEELSSQSKTQKQKINLHKSFIMPYL